MRIGGGDLNSIRGGGGFCLAEKTGNNAKGICNTGGWVRDGTVGYRGSRNRPSSLVFVQTELAAVWSSYAGLFNI